MRAQEARQIPISAYLEREGLSPVQVKKSGRELWYRSPIRDGDATPSFKVDTVKNLWFDHGAGKGGNVIDLVCELRRVTVAEALAILSGTASVGASQTRQQSRPAAGEKEKERPFVVTAVREITHPALIQYLEARAIPLALARAHLKQIHFSPVGSEKRYFGLGFRCGDGWDVRSPVFKGFVGTSKDVTLIDAGDGSSVAVFEGFLDYLSLLAYLGAETLPGSVMVLHSTAQTRRAIERLDGRSFASGIYLYLDHDQAGRAAMSAFRDAFGTSVFDKSDLYSGYDDLNEWRMDQSSRRLGHDRPR